MSFQPYKLSCSLFGHTADVRSVATSQKGNILSGSRDLSAKLWNRNSETSFVQIAAFTVHTNFVSSVCFLPATPRHTKGLLVTGSNDKIIRIFDPDLTIPIRVLTQHTNTVCKVAPGVQEWMLLSASWDETARGWKDNGTEWSSVTFSGHSATVWSVCQLTSGIVVTASADKTLRVYDKSANFQRVLNGHTDCVRDVISIGAEEIVSVANDATIRIWNVVSGECLKSLHGHGHYIYSIAQLHNGMGWVTSSEDRTVKVWTAAGEVTSILLPCSSVWSVAALPNGDIVAGSNDGAVRIFTNDPRRVADTQTLAEYDAQLAAVEEEASKNIGDVKLSELPGKEALYEPGRSDGQTKMIREGDKAVAYSWSAAEGTWQYVGQILGASGAGSNETGKTVFNGKEYDHVFNVDIEDGAAPLKLPYNKTEDPWLVAQKFIHDNDLPQSYLEQVANFIISNSKCEAQPQVQSNFMDPFTGSTRYVPQGSNSQNGDAPQHAPRGRPQVPTRFFPHREYLRFDQFKLAPIKDKLCSLNNEKQLGLAERDIDALLKKCESIEDINNSEWNTLEHLLNWPLDIVFPALDLTRILIKKRNVSERLCQDEFLSYVEQHLQQSPNNMLLLKIYSNMMSTEPGESLASRHRLKLTVQLLSVPLPYPKQTQIALATVILNLAILLNRSETREGYDSLLMASAEIMPSFCEEEAIYRALVALGTLLWNATDPRKDAKDFNTFLQRCCSDSSRRIKDCAEEVLSLIR